MDCDHHGGTSGRPDTGDGRADGLMNMKNVPRTSTSAWHVFHKLIYTPPPLSPILHRGRRAMRAVRAILRRDLTSAPTPSHTRVCPRRMSFLFFRCPFLDN